MLVEVDDVWLGVGAGAGAPGVSIIPANAGTDRTAVTIATAHVRCNLFTLQPPIIHYFVTPEEYKSFCINPNFVLADPKKLR